MKVAVITPYHLESLSVVERCHRSVLSQSHDCTHYLISDGHPKEEIDLWDAIHVRLPSQHSDNGNTPRGLGAILALNAGYDAFAFLDADNWYAPDHIATLVECTSRGGTAVAFSDRKIVLPSGQLCPFEDKNVLEREAVDTSCFFITRDAAYLLPIWCMMDPVMSPLCDLVMFAAIKQRGITYSWTNKATLYYESRWRSHFRILGLRVPRDEHTTDWSRLRANYDPDVFLRRLGFDPFGGIGPVEPEWQLCPVPQEE